MAWAMMNTEGEDVCGCRIAAIECVIMSVLFEAKYYAGQTENSDTAKRIGHLEAEAAT